MEIVIAVFLGAWLCLASALSLGRLTKELKDQEGEGKE